MVNDENQNFLTGRPLKQKISRQQHYEELQKLMIDFKMTLEETPSEERVKTLVLAHIRDSHNLGSNILCEVDK